MRSASIETAIVSDGTVRSDSAGSSRASNAQSISSVLIAKLNPKLPAGTNPAVSCQEGTPPAEELCATTTVQGRYTNGLHDDANGDGALDMCKGPPVASLAGLGRFLHIEQRPELAAAPGTSGAIGNGYQTVLDALAETWPACTEDDCALGPAQDGAAKAPDLACP
jgi:hypothetical protein